MHARVQNRPSASFRLLVLACALLLMGSCASRRSVQPTHEKDGVRYGITQGTFRGRWWNFYERGCSYLDGSFHEEAEKDFRAALRGRAVDQRWPRTYGLHFIPEYFPNRELGIVLYHQQRLEESIGHLETSLGQIFSARAAFYLEKARRDSLIATRTKVPPPDIAIFSPDGGAVVGATEVVLEGMARNDGYVSSVTIDGHPFDVRICSTEAAFSMTVPLAPGKNSIRVEAVNLLGQVGAVEVPVLSDVDGPMVSFDTPVIAPGTVRGMAFDPSGVATMTIAGKEARLTPGVDGTVEFSVTLAAESLSPPLRYACTDRLGNVTQGILPLDMLVLSRVFPDLCPASDRATSIPLGGGLYALALNGEQLAVAATPALTEGVSVEISNILDGQIYYMDEIVVSITVRSGNPIKTLELNGQEIPALPGRTSLRTSRRIRLGEGENLLTATATDAQGASGTVQRSVRREPSPLEMNRSKLAVAFLGNHGTALHPQTAEDGEYVMNFLASAQPVQRRFTVVDRSLLREILEEHDLSASLASRQNKLALGRLLPAEMMIAARIRRDRESIEIVLEGSSTETAVRILPRVDVAGPYDDLDHLIDTLALRLVQELPRVQGRVIQWDNPEITLDLNALQGVRNHLKCLVFRTEAVMHPDTGETLGERPVVLCEGLLNNVTTRFSTAEALPTEEGGDLESLNIETGHYVVIK